MVAGTAGVQADLLARMEAAWRQEHLEKIRLVAEHDFLDRIEVARVASGTTSCPFRVAA